MHISKKRAPLLKAFLMALILPLIMIFFITLINIGFESAFLFVWMKNYVIAVVIAFPLIILLSPMINRFVERISK